MSKKRKVSIEYKRWEATGDSIIKLTIAENLCRLPRVLNNTHCMSYLQSNKILASIRDSEDFPVKFKRTPSSPLNEESKGDEVECYIAFLYFNYGLDRAKRYVFNKIIAKHIIL